MTPLMEQFVSETRDLLQSISEQLLDVEKAADKQITIDELFRVVHTLKGNTGLFEFPDLTRVLHAGEDVMSETRDDQSLWDQQLTDLLFEAMDFVGQFCDSIEQTDGNPEADIQLADRLTADLRAYLAEKSSTVDTPATDERGAVDANATDKNGKKSSSKGGKRRPARAKGLPQELPALCNLQGTSLHRLWAACFELEECSFVTYKPFGECFFQGDDPLQTVRMAPGALALVVENELSSVTPEDLDPYQCVTEFALVCQADNEELDNHFRYVNEQYNIENITPEYLLVLSGKESRTLLEIEGIDKICQAVNALDWDGLALTLSRCRKITEPGEKAHAAILWLQFLLQHTGSSDAQKHQAMVIVCQRLCHDHRVSAFKFQPRPDSDQQAGKTEKTDSTESTAGHTVGPEQLAAAIDLLTVQRGIIQLEPLEAWANGRLLSAINVVRRLAINLNQSDALKTFNSASEQALAGQNESLIQWIDGLLTDLGDELPAAAEASEFGVEEPSEPGESAPEKASPVAQQEPPQQETLEQPDACETAPPAASKLKSKTTTEEPEAKSSSSSTASRSVKVDQEKIDRLMNLIGEMTVAKNALPFLAKRAEEHYALRDLSREIKEQYAVVNRIAEEMQDSIMQIRMMPFSFISMRFPRLVRDIARRLDKEVQLIIEGEDTEADKNIIESLAEPLIHIVRNSLDHGIETPEVRRQQGKPSAGTLTIRASQSADRVLIEIIDDGKGINPKIVRTKAFEKGLIDEATCQRLTDKEAVNLVLLPGFSTAEAISDLSGRGVGMDAVRNAVDKVNGSMSLDSEVGKGTRISIYLPMSIAVTRVMIVESDNQLMGVPMDQVLETVRVPRTDIHTVKHVQTTLLRDRIVPLKSLNDLLALPCEQQVNDEDEHAVLVARVGNDVIGLVVDDFRGSADIIQKPMTGVLSGMQAYSGAALIGDGSVLMVLNLKEIL